METIIEHLEKEIPLGPWCNQGNRKKWCPYFRILNRQGFCNLSEEYVERKECGINEEATTMKGCKIATQKNDRP